MDNTQKKSWVKAVRDAKEEKEKETLEENMAEGGEPLAVADNSADNIKEKDYFKSSEKFEDLFNEDSTKGDYYESETPMKESEEAEKFATYNHGEETDKNEKDDMESMRPKKAKRFLSVVLIIVVAAASGYAGGYWAQRNIASLPGTSIKISSKKNMQIGEAIAEKVNPSVVGIRTTVEYEVETFFGTQVSEKVSEGTGFIVDAKGYILTNSHVVGEGKAKNITVSLANGESYEGKALWADKALDLAIVKIDAKGLVAAELGDSKTVRIGAYAGAIGNPLGLSFERSFSEGVISGLNRSIEVKNDVGQTMRIDGLIQTDASINSGNSGGPLLNAKGQVIGINSAKAGSGEGLGFAIPINTAKPIIEGIKKNGKFERAYIGISGGSVSDLSSSDGEGDIEDKLGTDTGVFVSKVYPGSPAEEAGIREEDIILAIDDKKVESINAMIRILLDYKPGDKVRLKVMRDKKILKFNVKLTKGIE